MRLNGKLLIGLMMLGLLTSYRATAQDIETLVMPGQVIAAHADVESECSSCHKMFDKSGQRVLCLDCHEDVAGDINQERGFHGLRAEAREDKCASCHADHEGRDADIVRLDEATFDHRFTDFELKDSHVEAECDGCHAVGEKHREAPSTCVDCHRDDDGHEGSLGTDCANCHKPTEWADARAEFDHSETGYPLVGNHRQVTCLDCHADATFTNTPTTCFGCHEADDNHEGRNGTECETCHNPKDWKDTSFDHSRDTDFELLGKHALLTCTDCHSSDPYADELEPTCISCHLEDDEHKGHNGEECGSCHNNSEWQESTFVHDLQADFKLLGSHKEVACNDCHVEPIFEVALMTTCVSCHEDDEPHQTSLGRQCENCHTEVNWQDPVFFDHDLTDFPLLGHHTEQECTDCHETKAFGDTGSGCITCHSDDDPHRGNFDDSCESCHNPVAWENWLFDHDLQTHFPLDGAHTDVTCAECHRSPLVRMIGSNRSCGSCHRSDDIHDGEFGSDCGRCHSADSFKDVRTIQ